MLRRCVSCNSWRQYDAMGTEVAWKAHARWPGGAAYVTSAGRAAGGNKARAPPHSCALPTNSEISGFVLQYEKILIFKWRQKIKTHMCENTSRLFCLQKKEDKQNRYTPSQSLLPSHFNLQNVKENGKEKMQEVL